LHGQEVIRSFDGHSPTIDPTAFVHERAEVIGKVRIGPRASVWPGAVLRGDIEEIVLGAEANVQDNAVLHTDPGVPVILGEGVTVGHGAIIHASRIGNNVLIGMGAIVLGGAIVEDDCLVAAGALVVPGARVPKGHLAVGSPAKFVRALTPEEIEGTRRNAAHYVDNARKHRDTSHAR
jgi:carbonic anhydrase/acetyltransferase-like protein (isoleucine patch superfamily)